MGPPPAGAPEGSDPQVTTIVLTILVTVFLAAGVVLYVAFPHRGQDVPHTPWLGAAMRKAVRRLPTLDHQRPGDRD